MGEWSGAASAYVNDIESLPDVNEWTGLTTIIKVTSYRHILKGPHIPINEPAVRYYISSLDESVEGFARRIREYWHVEKRCDPRVALRR